MYPTFCIQDTSCFISMYPCARMRVCVRACVRAGGHLCESVYVHACVCMGRWGAVMEIHGNGDSL